MYGARKNRIILAGFAEKTEMDAEDAEKKLGGYFGVLEKGEYRLILI